LKPMGKAYFHKFLSWIYHRLDEVNEIERQAYLHRIAALAPSTQIGPEGTVENLLGDPACVIVGENSYVRGRLLTYGHGGKISIGNWCYIGVRTEIWSMDSVTIGDRVLIAHDVNIHDGTAHSKDLKERHEHYHHILRKGHPSSWNDLPGISSSPVAIEDDVWINFGVTILKGVRIGKGSVIAAKSIVTEDVPENVLYRNRINPIITPLKA